MITTTANYQITEGTIFRYFNLYYYVETVSQKQPHATAFCNIYDINTKQQIKSDTSKKFTVNAICKAFYDGNAAIIDPYSARHDIPPLTYEQQLKFEMWSAYIDALLSVTQGRYSRANADIAEAKKLVDWKAFNHLVPSNSSCQARVKKVDEANGEKRVLIPGGFTAMKGASRIAPATEELIFMFIHDQFLVDQPKEKVIIDSIYDDFKAEWELRNKESPSLYPKLPCRETFYQRIRRLPPELVALYRENNKTKAQSRQQRQTNFITDRILERVEMDAIHVAIGIVKFENINGKRKRVYRGQIVLMFGLDVFTRCILGYSYTIDTKPGESADLALQCFKNINLPKARSNWTSFGKPFAVVSDATTAATSNFFHQAVEAAGVAHIVTPVNEPYRKPHIERFNLTLRNEFLSKFQCYVASKLYRDHDHLNIGESVKKRAMSVDEKHCLTEEDFIEQLEDYITNHYHMSGHTNLNNRAPYDVWNNSVENFPFQRTVLFPNDPLFLKLGLKSRESKIYREGYVLLGYEKYASPKLKALYNRGVKTISFYYSDIDFRTVCFIHEGWHVATLALSNHTPSDTTQRAELKSCRENQHSYAPKRDRKRFHPQKGANARKKQKKKLLSSKSQESQPINMLSPDATNTLDNAENEIMKQAGVSHSEHLNAATNEHLESDSVEQVESDSDGEDSILTKLNDRKPGRLL